MTADLVIFDCDGVLVDSEPITNRLLRDDLASRGLDLSYDEVVHRFVGGTMRAVGEEARAAGANIPDDWVDGFYEKMYGRLAEGTPLIPGIETLLDALDAANIPYAVGSNGSERKMQITLGPHKQVWSRLKDRLYSAHTYGVAKPEPDLFLRAARDADVSPDKAVVIDDSPTGCRAAKRAGIRCLGFAQHDNGARLAAEGAVVVHSMEGVRAMLGLTRP